MPELPDVEIFKRYAARTALHKKIQNVDVNTAKILEGVTKKKVSRELRGEKFKSAKRYGKYLFLKFGKKFLLIHFGMTGELNYAKELEEGRKHDRMVIDFSNGYHLAYINQRMLGKVSIIEDINDFLQEKELGPDAQRVKMEKFMEILKNSEGKIKTALMNQKNLAGIGNIYADEILFQSGIKPKTKLKSLDDKDLKSLYKSMNKVFDKAIKYKANPDNFPRSFLVPKREKGGECPKCGKKLKTTKINGRTSYYCSKCQSKG